MIVLNRRCPRCAGQLYLESDPKAGCEVIGCLHCGHEVGAIKSNETRRRVSPKALR